MARGLRIVIFGAFGFGCLVGALESAVLLARSPDIRLVDPAAEFLAVLGRYGIVASLLACGARILRPRWTPSKQAFAGGFLLLFVASFLWLHSRILPGVGMFAFSSMVGTAALALGCGCAAWLASRIAVAKPRAGILFCALLLAASSGKVVSSGVGSSVMEPPAPEAGLPDVTLVLIDTLRADRLSCYGYTTSAGQRTSPIMDALADQGVRFDAAYAAAPWTRPSVASLFSGLHCSAHGVNTIYRALPEEAVTLAELFRSRGYRTGGFSANSHISQVFGFAQGFDHFWCLTDKNLLTLLSWGEVERRLQRIFKRVPFVEDHAGIVNRETLAWAREAASRPTFTYVHYVDPHFPYAPPEDLLHANRWNLDDLTRSILPQVDPIDPFPFATRRLTDCGDCGGEGYRPGHPEDSCASCDLEKTVEGVHALYEAEIRFVDRELGILLDQLEELGLAGEEDFVFVVSDHGEEFYEHRQWGHGHSMFEELMRIPCIARGPGIPAGTVVADPVGLVDILPTLGGVAGFPLPAGIHGLPLQPYWTAGATPRPHDVFGEKFHVRDLMMLRSGKMKFIQIPDTGPESNGERFDMVFDLEDDPSEAGNLAGLDEAGAKDLRTRALAIRSLALSGALDSERMELDEETRRRLAEMGYAEGFGEEAP
jgi:arylsulfatase A-like enzyme